MVKVVQQGVPRLRCLPHCSAGDASGGVVTSGGVPSGGGEGDGEGARDRRIACDAGD